MEAKFKDKKSKSILVVTQETIIEKMKKETDKYELIKGKKDKKNKENKEDNEGSQETSGE